MTRSELESRMDELTAAATRLDEPDKTFTLSEIDRIAIQIDGMALVGLRQKLEQINLTDLQEIDAKIAAAKDATQGHQSRVAAINIGLSILKTAIGIVL